MCFTGIYMENFPIMSPSRLCLAILAALSLFVTGCSLGYSNLRPGENSSLYAELFNDVLTSYDEPHWLWVRGSIPLDYNGDGRAEEEAIIATIQAGDERRPGPIQTAFLVICRIGESGERTALARALLFNKDPISGAPKPRNDLCMTGETSFTRARAQVVQDKVTLKESVVVYFYGDALPGNVWYAGYGLENGKLEKNFEAVFWQNRPGLLVTNLDRAMESARYGYQMAFGVDAIPADVLARLESAGDKTPLWGHVYARDENGMYRQADARFGEHYDKLESSWNQFYLKAIMHGLPPEDLAWIEYHLGILNHYTGDNDMAGRLLDKAGKGAKNEMLKAGIENALPLLRGEDATNWSPVRPKAESDPASQQAK